MLYRDDRTVRDTLGRAVPNAYVYYCQQPAVTNTVPPSPLIAIALTVQGTPSVGNNPLITNGYGQIAPYMAAGIYTVVEVWNGIIQNVYPDQAVGVSQGGTVTNVALVMPSDFTVTGSPITNNGTFTVTENVENANNVHIGWVTELLRCRHGVLWKPQISRRPLWARTKLTWQRTPRSPAPESSC